MKPGTVVEYIDRHRIISAAILDSRKEKLRLLTETNRESALSQRRLLHQSDESIDLSGGRDSTVSALKDIAKKRESLANEINITELWETVNREQDWIDLKTMTTLCFPNNSSGDHEAAVIRAIFNNRNYFKFKGDCFFPNTEEQVEVNIARQKAIDHQERLVEEGGAWLKRVVHENADPKDTGDFAEKHEVLEILKGYYIFGKESGPAELAKAMIQKAGIEEPESIFKILLQTGRFRENENIDLYRYGIHTVFPDAVTQAASDISSAPDGVCSPAVLVRGRKDLSATSLMTIDGAFTLDFDDAISIEDCGDFICLGVHITDVGHFVKKGDILDAEAVKRGSSIYMPDQKIPMLPDKMSEGTCSLIAGHLRPAVSTMIRLGPLSDIRDFEVIPSIVRIENQHSYNDINFVADSDPNIKLLHDIAHRFRQKRLDQGAVHISLPEINVWIDGGGEVKVNKVNRESPARMLVSEIMIMANWCMARFLMKNNVPAIFRSQGNPQSRLFQGNEGTLFQNYMQRRFLKRLVLGPQPERHSGLGLDAYITATSPIRKYMDLVNQRQMRSIFGFEPPYTSQELNKLIQTLERPMAAVQKIQNQRNRYWILKYLEGRVGCTEEALVLLKHKNGYQVLMKDYLVECDLPKSGYIDLKPTDLVHVKIQYVNARRDVVSVVMA